MVKLKIVLVIFFVLITFFNVEVLAAEINLPNTAINPDKYLFYSIKRLVEKGIIYTKWSKESKVSYFRDLTLTRTAELKYVVENKLLGEVQRSAQRISYQVGILSDFVAFDPQLKNNRQSITDLLTSLKTPLESLRDKYTYGSSYWMLVQHSINSIDLNLEKLK